MVVLYETDSEDSIGSGNFSLRNYLSLIKKDSVTHMHCLAGYIKEGLPFGYDSEDSYLCFCKVSLQTLSYFSLLY